MYLHCTYGFERTGTMYYLLERLLGVPEQDIIWEYESTTLFHGGNSVHEIKAVGTVLKGKEEHISVYNYLYKAYVTSLFKFIYSCFIYDQPVKAPDTPESYVKVSSWRFPVFLVVQEENGDIVIY